MGTRSCLAVACALTLLDVAACGGGVGDPNGGNPGPGAGEGGAAEDGSPDARGGDGGGSGGGDASPSDDGGSSDTGGGDDGGQQGAGLAPSPFFGFSSSNVFPNHWPSVTYGMQRFWDTPPLQWPDLNTAPGVFDFTNLDADLATAFSKGTLEGFYTLARTPPWATSKPSDSSCAYATSPVGGGNGECDAPMDLAADGSGTNGTWKAWITAIATHVNDPQYLKSHAHIRYWEVWNEPDTQIFWAGSIAQLARLVEDANCIITGRGVVHEKGDGTATPCTAKAIDPNALIVMPSAHAKSVALAYGANELYCSDNPTGYQLPCPNPPDAISAAVDVINFHMKPGNETGDIESAMQMYVSNIESKLKPAEKAKPLWDGEAQYASKGFTGAYTDPDMAASFVPRFTMIEWSLGISGMAWYDEKNAPPSVSVAMQQAYDWMVGSTLVQPCKANGTVWSCTLGKSGKQYLVMWDSGQSCANGSCTTKPQTVAAQWTTSQDMTTMSAPAPISNHVVPVGIKPIVLGT